MSDASETVWDSRTECVIGDLRRDSLVGSYFLGSEGEQGIVVAEPAPTVYLVQVFAPDGSPDGTLDYQTMCPLEDMLGWAFFDDLEWQANAVPQLTAKMDEAKRRASPRGVVGKMPASGVSEGDRVKIPAEGGGTRQLRVAQVRSDASDPSLTVLVTANGRAFPLPMDAEVEVLPS